VKLFSEKVNPTLTNSTLNIIQVEDYEEIFFGVYEIEINKTKYPVEKISEHNGDPVVSVPVLVEGNEKVYYPFVLSKGKQEVLFNENNTLETLETLEVINEDVEIDIDDEIEIVDPDNPFNVGGWQSFAGGGGGGSGEPFYVSTS
tara:strand:- start:12265 stop:12699 length:435 start_codon:yes stop_codon:yes gene_type:complete